MGQTNLTPDFTARLQFKLSVGQSSKMSLLRVREDINPGSELNDVIVAYLEALTALYTLQGLVPSNKRPHVAVRGIEYAPRGGKFAPYGTAYWGYNVCQPVGTLQVIDYLKVMSISGRAVSGKKWIHYFYGVTADIGSGGLDDTYGDMAVDASEIIPHLLSWFSGHWVGENSLSEYLVAPDNSPLQFVRPRLMVRFSTKRQNAMRRK